MSRDEPNSGIMWPSVALMWATVVLCVAAWRLGWTMPIVVGGVGTCAAAGTWFLLSRAKDAGGHARERLTNSLRAMATMLRINESDPAAPDVQASRSAEFELALLASTVEERVRVSMPAIRARAESLAAILDALHEPVLVTDASGLVIVRNREADEFFQTLRGGVVGRSMDDLFTQADAMRLHAIAVGGLLGTGQVRFQSSLGTRVYAMVAAPVSLAVGSLDGATPIRGVVVTLRDVTDLAKAVQLKTEFVANASHELRTPLASIKGAVETLRDGGSEDPAMASRLTEMIATNAARLEELVRDLMDLSRLESPEVLLQAERVDIGGLCTSVVRLFESACDERKLTIQCRFADAPREILSDRQLLQLVLQNLIDNATKFAYEGTTIRVEWEPKADGGAKFRVIDEGVGIPINQQQRIFERFYQVDAARTGGSQRRGTGLGLAIVKHALKRLGGTISVQSVWKQGTTMEVELPAAPPAWSE